MEVIWGPLLGTTLGHSSDQAQVSPVIAAYQLIGGKKALF